MSQNTAFLFINPFVPNSPFLYPLKTSENLTVFWCFKGAEKGCIREKWVHYINNERKKALIYLAKKKKPKDKNQEKKK